jgi:hypothetical protein
MAAESSGLSAAAAALIAADKFGITESPTLNISASVSGPSPVIVLRSGLSGKTILVCTANV